jgi:hypothetical protein
MQNMKVFIYDAVGKLHWIENTIGETIQINAESWSSGLYFITIRSDEGKLIHTGKIVIE